MTDPIMLKHAGRYAEANGSRLVVIEAGELEIESLVTGHQIDAQGSMTAGVALGIRGDDGDEAPRVYFTMQKHGGEMQLLAFEPATALALCSMLSAAAAALWQVIIGAANDEELTGDEKGADEKGAARNPVIVPFSGHGVVEA